jgi:exodeoxyribonuclease V alpha subunit
MKQQHLFPGDDFHAVLDEWVASGRVRGIDRTFARFLEDTAPEAPPRLLLLAALTSLASSHGHSCIDIQETLDQTLNQWAPAPQPSPPLDAAYSTDELDYPPLTDPAGSAPLAYVPTPRPRLYLKRYFRCEQRIQEFIHTAVADSCVPTAMEVREALSRLFPEGDPRGEWSRVACALATRTRFSLVTGGPGSGKTTVVVRMLALLHALYGPLQIRLAAPTGKAAARLQESIAAHLQHLPAEYHEAIPQRVSTLHRLLRLGGAGRTSSYTRAHPLPVDLVVIDEASMVDVEMMATLVEALPAQARLILLGDKDQLASVEAGAVLADICLRAEDGHYTSETEQWIREATGVEIPPAMLDRDEGTALDQAITMLRFSHRFSPTGPIGAMADAVRRGDVTAIRSLQQNLPRDPAPESIPGPPPVSAATPIPEPSPAPMPVRPPADEPRSPSAPANDPPGGGSGERELLRILTVSSPDSAGFRTLAEHHGEYLRSLAPGADGDTDDARAAALLKRYARFQILCAVREGPWGVLNVNGIVRAVLADLGLVDRDSTWYAGRPVMVTRNDYRLGLMNGDIGITMELESGLLVAFEGSHGGIGPGSGPGTIRWVRPVRLASVETVYAMTVHKSQGSEFDHVALVLPDREVPVLTRELLYTGITRARRRVTVVTNDPETLSAAAQKTISRTGGLASMLHNPVQS